MPTGKVFEKRITCSHCGEEFCQRIHLRRQRILLGDDEQDERKVILECPECGKKFTLSVREIKRLPDCEKEEPQVASPQDTLHIEIIAEQRKKTLKILDEAAKQLMTACSFLLTVYVFLLDNFVKRASGPLPSPLLRYMIPPIGLLAAFVIPLIVTLYPWPYSVLLNAPEEAQKAIQNAQKRKLMGIWAATAIFLISVIIMLMVVLKS